MNLGDATYFVPFWSAKGSEKSLKIRSQSLEIRSIQLCSSLGLPCAFSPMSFLLGHVN